MEILGKARARGGWTDRAAAPQALEHCHGWFRLVIQRSLPSWPGGLRTVTVKVPVAVLPEAVVAVQVTVEVVPTKKGAVPTVWPEGGL